MTKRKISFAIVSLLLAMAVILSGCTSSEKAPKEALQAAMSKSAELKSYSFKGSLKFEDFQIESAEIAEEQMAIMNTLKNAELSWTGAYKSDPMMAEINLKIETKGDLAITFTVPIIATQKKTWIKVPNIPMLPIPEDLVDKYLELDMEQIAKEAGQDLPTVDVAKSQKMANDILGIVFKHVDEEQYLSSVKVKDAGLPEDVKADRVVKLQVDQSKLEPFIKTVLEKIAPEVVDLLANNEEYRTMLQLSKEDLDEAKAQLKDAQSGDISANLKEMQQELKSLEITSNIGIDKKEFPVYTDASVKAAFDSEGNKGSFALKVVSQMSDINGDVKFEIGEPKAEDIIPFDQLMEQFGGMFGGMEDL